MQTGKIVGSGTGVSLGVGVGVSEGVGSSVGVAVGVVGTLGATELHDAGFDSELMNGTALSLP